MTALEMMTVAEVILVFGVIMSLGTIVKWVYDTFHKPKDDIKEVRESLNEIKNKLDDDFKKLTSHEDRLEHIESRLDYYEKDKKDVHDGLRVILGSLKQITKSILEDGNNHEGLRTSEKEIDDYMRAKV